MDICAAARATVDRFAWRVFPTRNKVPLIDKWKENASYFPEGFDWSGADGYGIALRPGSIVVDMDVDAFDSIAPAYAETERALGTLPPDVLTVRTPSGGRHLFFAGPTDLMRQSKLGPHVDTRIGGKGYVIGAGSPGYEWEGEASATRIRPFPSAGRASTPGPTTPSGSTAGLGDGPNARSWDIANRLLDTAAHNAPAGEDHLRYTLACKLRDLGFPEELALGRLNVWNDMECDHPRDAAQIEKAVANAYRFARDAEPGALAAPTAREAFADFMEPEPEEPTSPSGKAAAALSALLGARARVATLRESANEPPPGWLVPGVILDKGVTALYGPPKRGKTFAAVDLACSIAAGRPWLGQWETRRKGPVLYLALEGADEVRARARAWGEHHGVDISDDLIVVEASIPLNDTGLMKEIAAALRLAVPEPALLVLDTYSRALPLSGLDENSAADQSRAGAALEDLGEWLDCAVVAVAHAGKDGTRGMRGSNAFLAVCVGQVSAEMENGVLKLLSEEQRRGPRGATLCASPVTEGEFPVWQGREPLVGDGKAVPIDYARMRDKAFRIAVLKAATHAAEAALLHRSKFLENVRSLLPQIGNGWTMPDINRRLVNLFERQPELQAAMDAGNNRIAILPRAERARLFAEHNLPPEAALDEEDTS